MFINPKEAPAWMHAAAEVHETLTTPDSEDWLIIPRGKKLYITAFQEARLADGKKKVWAKQGFCRTADLRKQVDEMQMGHNLGCVTIILLRDSERFGGYELLEWFTKMAREKSFSVVSHTGPATTAEAIRTAKERANPKCEGTA